MPSVWPWRTATPCVLHSEDNRIFLCFIRERAGERSEVPAKDGKPIRDQALATIGRAAPDEPGQAGAAPREVTS